MKNKAQKDSNLMLTQQNGYTTALLRLLEGHLKKATREWEKTWLPRLRVAETIDRKMAELNEILQEFAVELQPGLEKLKAIDELRTLLVRISVLVVQQRRRLNKKKRVRVPRKAMKGRFFATR